MSELTKEQLLEEIEIERLKQQLAELKTGWVEPIIDPEFIIEKDGKKLVLIGGLVKAAKKKGFIRFAPQLNNVLDDGTVVFKSEVNFDNFSAVGWGSARREDMTDEFKPHYIAVAETKANARALKLALGITGEIFEEVSGESVSKTKASESQLKHAAKLINAHNKLYPEDNNGDLSEYVKINYNINNLNELSMIQASEIITKFK